MHYIISIPRELTGFKPFNLKISFSNANYIEDKLETLSTTIFKFIKIKPEILDFVYNKDKYFTDENMVEDFNLKFKELKKKYFLCLENKNKIIEFEKSMTGNLDELCVGNLFEVENFTFIEPIYFIGPLKIDFECIKLIEQNNEVLYKIYLPKNDDSFKNIIKQKYKIKNFEIKTRPNEESICYVVDEILDLYMHVLLAKSYAESVQRYGYPYNYYYKILKVKKGLILPKKLCKKIRPDEDQPITIVKF